MGARLALKRLREDGRGNVDEAAIFRTIENMREIANGAVRASKVARRQRERRLRIIEKGQLKAVAHSAAPIEETVVPAIDGRQPHERMLPFEEWN